MKNLCEGVTSVCVCPPVSWADAEAAIRSRLLQTQQFTAQRSQRSASCDARSWHEVCARQTGHRKRKFIQRCLRRAKVHRGHTCLCFDCLQLYLAVWLCFVSVLSQRRKVTQTGHMSIHKPNLTALWLALARQKPAKAAAFPPKMPLPAKPSVRKPLLNSLICLNPVCLRQLGSFQAQR